MGRAQRNLSFNALDDAFRYALPILQARMVAWHARMAARPSLQATTWERVGRMAQAA